MGTIETKGKAERKYECDMMAVTITFQENGADPTVISKAVMDSCEKFIGEMLDFSKLEIKDIHIDEDNVEEGRYSSDASNSANRTISIQTAYDMKLVNLIRQHLNEGRYRHNIHVDYEYSKVNELHALVVKEALLEAKAQADTLAESLGMEIEGLKKAEEQGGRYTDFMVCECEGGLVGCSNYALTDDLAGKIKTMSVEVHAEWKVK
ncbi:MAG: SIMPL domain-containing protein [Lachnospiraceae bacterium]|nr:SIMPL domain-containing protein [Lachnospiraceae bacterium]